MHSDGLGIVVIPEIYKYVTSHHGRHGHGGHGDLAGHVGHGGHGCCGEHGGHSGHGGPGGHVECGGQDRTADFQT